jgi:hypothetical protein
LAGFDHSEVPSARFLDSHFGESSAEANAAWRAHHHDSDSVVAKLLQDFTGFP